MQDELAVLKIVVGRLESAGLTWSQLQHWASELGVAELLAEVRR